MVWHPFKIKWNIQLNNYEHHVVCDVVIQEFLELLSICDRLMWCIKCNVNALHCPQFNSLAFAISLHLQAIEDCKRVILWMHKKRNYLDFNYFKFLYWDVLFLSFFMFIIIVIPYDKSMQIQCHFFDTWKNFMYFLLRTLIILKYKQVNLFFKLYLTLVLCLWLYNSHFEGKVLNKWYINFQNRFWTTPAKFYSRFTTRRKDSWRTGDLPPMPILTAWRRYCVALSCCEAARDRIC